MKRLISFLLAMGFFIASKILGAVWAVENEPIVTNLRSLGVVQIFVFLLLTAIIIKYFKVKTIRILSDLFIAFYISVFFQIFVYFAYSYTLISGDNSIGIFFMDARNFFWMGFISLFVVNIAEIAALKTKEEYEESISKCAAKNKSMEREINKLEDSLSKIEKAFRQAAIDKGFSDIEEKIKESKK